LCARSHAPIVEGAPGGVEQLDRGAGPQRGDVVDSIAAREHQPDHAQRLGPAVRAVPGQVQPTVDQLCQPDPFCQHRGREQPAYGTRFVSSKLTRPGSTHAMLALSKCPSVLHHKSPQQGHRCM